MIRRRRRRDLLPGKRRYREEMDALERDRAHHQRIREQWPFVRFLAATLDQHRERNHFSESIAQIYRGDMS